MATTQFQEAGSNATGGLEFYTSTTGTVASDTVVSRLPDPRSIKCTCDGSGNPAYCQKNTVLADAGRRISVYFYFDSMPDNGNDAASGRPFLQLLTSVPAGICSMGLRSTGILGFGSGASFKAGTTALSPGTWYRITLSYVFTTTSNWSAKVYLNGNLEISASNTDFTLASVSTSMIRIGYTALVAAMANKFNHFADLYIDNGTDLADVAAAGKQRGVTSKKPNANNVNNYNTAIGANPANRWTNVNEVPINLTNGWGDTTASSQNENYGLEGVSQGNVNLTAATLISRTAWIWAKQLTGVAGTPSITDNGTNTSITLTTSPALYTVTTDSASYPSNAAGIGMVSAGVAADETALYECGTLIAYDFVAPTTSMFAYPMLPNQWVGPMPLRVLMHPTQGYDTTTAPKVDYNFVMPTFPLNRFVGPPALWAASTVLPYFPGTALAPATNTEFGPVPQRVPNINVGPQVLRVQQPKPPFDNKAAAVDYNFIMPGPMPNINVGAQVLRVQQAKPPFDNQQPASDTNFIFPQMPGNRYVGPQVLRIGIQPMPYLPDPDLAPATNTEFGPVMANVPNRFVGPTVLRVGFGMPYFPGTALAPTTNTEFGPVLANMPNINVGPQVLRVQQPKPPFDNQQPLSDTNFIMPGPIPNINVGPQVLRTQQAKPPFDNQAPVIDFNFVMPTYAPSKTVGPQILRGRPLPYVPTAAVGRNVYTIFAGLGSFAVTGKPANLFEADYNFIMPTYPGSPTTGPQVLRGRVPYLPFSRQFYNLFTGPGSFTVTGKPANLFEADYNFILPTYPASKTTGPIVLRARPMPYLPVSRQFYSLLAAPGSFTLTGQNANLFEADYNFILPTYPSSKTTGPQVLRGRPMPYLLFSKQFYTLPAGAGSFIVTGKPSTLTYRVIPRIVTLSFEAMQIFTAGGPGQVFAAFGAGQTFAPGGKAAVFFVSAAAGETFNPGPAAAQPGI